MDGMCCQSWFHIHHSWLKAKDKWIHTHTKNKHEKMAQWYFGSFVVVWIGVYCYILCNVTSIPPRIVVALQHSQLFPCFIYLFWLLHIDRIGYHSFFPSFLVLLSCLFMVSHLSLWAGSDIWFGYASVIGNRYSHLTKIVST